MDIEIRDAVAADLAGLNRLETRAFSGDRLSLRSFRRLMASASASLRIAGPTDSVDGYCLLFFRRGSRVARLYSIAVDASARGSGVAAALMDDAERAAARRGCRAMRLEVRPDNEAALRLYRRCGYRPIGMYRQYYADGSDALRLEKPLAGEEVDQRRRIASPGADRARRPAALLVEA
jgi:ribosomal protein S18 acetylase RimI-like enzyme